MANNLITVPENAANNAQTWASLYQKCRQQLNSGGNVIIDCSNLRQIDVEYAKGLWGRLLIDDVSGPITCKNLRYQLFKSIADGIQLRFSEKYPQGIQSRFRFSRITKPQVEMINGSVWSTIQLGEEVTQLLQKDKLS